MKIKFMAIFTYLIIGFAALAQQRQELNSQIKQVSVYFNKAAVERMAKVSLAPGTYQLVFNNLSPLLDEQSIALSVPKGMVIQSIATAELGGVDEAKPEQILLLEDSIDKIDQELYLVRSDLESIRLQKELLLANRNIGGTNGLKADELEDVLGIYQQKLSEFKTANLRLGQSEKLLSKQRAQLSILLEQYNQGKRALNRQVVASVLVEKTLVDAALELKYLVSEVVWEPVYDVRVAKLGGPITFVLKAKIQQSSGEDWMNVHLRVSDVDASSATYMPSLEPYVLRFQEPIVYKGNAYGGGAGAPMPMEELEYKFADSIAASQASEATYFTPPEIYRTPTGVSFDTKVPYTIPSDGKYYQVELNRFELPATYKLMSIPKLDERVFVNAAVQSNDILNQLNAQANIYFEDRYSGNSFISRQENDTMLFALGEEKRIVLKRSKVSDQSSTSIFGGTKRERSIWQIQLQNTTNETLEVEVFDQVPISANKELEVKVIDTGSAMLDAESGRLTWKIKLLPKQEQKLRFEYELSYPKGKLVNAY